MRTNKFTGLRLWFELQRLFNDSRGQDLIEYALMAGFVATSVVTLFDPISQSFVTIMSKINAELVSAASS